MVMSKACAGDKATYDVVGQLHDRVFNMTFAKTGWQARGPRVVGVALTCIIKAQCEEGLAGALWPVCPDFVHKVLFHRYEVVPSTSKYLGHLLPVI